MDASEALMALSDQFFPPRAVFVYKYYVLLVLFVYIHFKDVSLRTEMLLKKGE